MRSTGYLALICLVVLTLAGWSKPAGTDVSPPEAAPTDLASALREQALALMASGDLSGAAAWQLLAGRYEEAAVSAENALKLDPDHAGAQHNAGMANLRLGHLGVAAHWLDKSARAQPERFEHLIGLAHLALTQGRAALAAEYLRQARQLPGGEAAAAELQPSVERLTAPAQAPSECLAELADGPVSLCLARGADHYEIDLRDEPFGQRLAVGSDAQRPSLEKAPWPDGGVAYWLRTDSAVVDVHKWHAFVVRNGRLKQVLFKGGTDVLMLSTDDHIKSFAMPSVSDAELRASHRHEADPRQTVSMTFRVTSDGLGAEQVRYHVGSK